MNAGVSAVESAEGRAAEGCIEGEKRVLCFVFLCYFIFGCLTFSSKCGA